MSRVHTEEYLTQNPLRAALARETVGDCAISAAREHTEMREEKRRALEAIRDPFARVLALREAGLLR